MNLLFILSYLLISLLHGSNGSTDAEGNQKLDNCVFGSCSASDRYCVNTKCLKPGAGQCAKDSHCKAHKGPQCKGFSSSTFGRCEYKCGKRGDRCDKYDLGCCDSKCKNGFCGCVERKGRCEVSSDCCEPDHLDVNNTPLIRCYKNECRSLESICKLNVGNDCSENGAADCIIGTNPYCIHEIHCGNNRKCTLVP